MVVLVRHSQVLLAGSLCLVCLIAQPARSQARRVVHVAAERLKSDDTAHGFRVAGTNVNIVIPKRGRQEVVTTLRVDTPGRYEFECTRMCGAGHNFMRGVLIVRESVKKQ